ncbi:MAG: hypothetical protein CVV27_09090 [Candidatus Melainabacteria bacterium HGW-Melainabacteria-1]|nr:MAG: hypothetical protein CVV27_09090 [Candidatus Melainabacteria bacterium HGW-Melainabacteria-1]
MKKTLFSKPLLISLTVSALLMPQSLLAQTQWPIQNPLQQLTGQSSSQDKGITAAIEKIRKIQASYDQKLADPNPWAVFEAYSGETFSDQRRQLLQPFFPGVLTHPDYAALKQKLFEQRKALARRGLNLEGWQMWQYDGQTVSEGHQKFFQAIEQQLNRVSRSKTGSASASEAEALKKIDEILKRPEFSSDPVLVHYKQQFVLDQLAGARLIHHLKQVRFVGSELRDLRNRIKNRTPGSQTQLKAIQEQAKRTIGIIDGIKAAGLKLADHSVVLDERDPLSETWNLDKVRSELVNIGKLK